MVYRLDSVDAYERKLVKQIEVSELKVKDSHNLAYVKLLKVDNRHSPITAQIEIDVLQKTGEIRRAKKTVRQGADLMDASGGRNVYEGYIVNDIYCEVDKEYIDFTSRPEIVRLNQAIGEVDEDQYKRLQIRKTIEEHLDKELRLRPQGLKVLSLFFIDRVANYRIYDEDGNPQLGKYAQIFEEEYAHAIRKPKYDSLFQSSEGIDRETAVEGVHDGYFAVDRKKTRSGETIDMLKDSRGEGTAQADESAYRLIMQDKERLLSFGSKLKFIFSHSALKEGWDNPNVFQICTLNETGSVIKKRQEIGRGLRIAVNQDGERVYGFDVNTLTLMANESYEDFARKLQKEIEEEEGIRFGIVEPHMFANIPIAVEGGKTEYLGTENSTKIWEHLRGKGYVDAKGRVQDELRKALKEGVLDIPEDLRDRNVQIAALLRKVAGNLNIRNAGDRRQVQLNKAIYLSDDFKALWDRIKYRTTFRVNFDCEALVKQCAETIERMPAVGKARFVYRKSQVEIDRGGVQVKDPVESTHVYDAQDFQLPDIVSYLQNETQLTRRSLVEILTRSRRLDDFKRNPQKFIEQVTAIVQDQMRRFIVDGIKYQKIGDDAFYVQELFQNEELHGYLSRNMLESQKSVYGHVVYDSDVERDFAERFERSEDVKVYAKLPHWFKIDTPLGPYNPDWAVLVEVDGASRLYFVLESKGGLFSESLRASEQAKIECGQKHFEALDSGARFSVASNFDSFAAQFGQ
jgi:type III restriction enzyme